MDDQAEIHNVIEGNLTLKQYFKDRKLAKFLLVNNKADQKPSKRMLLLKILNNLKLMPLVKTLEKAFHKDEEIYIMKLKKKDIKKYINKNNFNLVEINKSSFDLISNSIEERKKFKKEFKNAKALALFDDKNLVGRAIIKTKNSPDRFIKIKNSNSYLITNVYINEQYRGNNYQCLLVEKLIEKYVKDAEFNIYTGVYTWNIPSIKNFQRLGFKIENSHTNIRVLKHSINKIKI